MQREPQRQMLADIDHEFDRCGWRTGFDAPDPVVRAAMARVDRSRFVPPQLLHRASDDSALPIGCGQTISQPFIVALMSTLLRLQPGDRVLEIGTGSGYQAAILAEIVGQVFSIEVIPELALSAAALLQQLGYHNVHVRAGDGWAGWPELAPFDGIIVTCAAETLPEGLLAQLVPAGHLVLPLGPSDDQRLLDVTMGQDSKPHLRDVLGVRFVPLVHGT